MVLPCRVNHLGPASLSWVRLSGPTPAASHLTVLSSGTILFSSSPRLALLHHEGSPDWTLQITGVILRDGGMYECQVSRTEPRPNQQERLPGEHRAKDVSGGEPRSGRGHRNSWSWTCPGPEGCLQYAVAFDLLDLISRASNWVQIVDANKPQFWLQECLHLNQETQSPWSALLQNTKYHRPISPGKTTTITII